MHITPRQREVLRLLADGLAEKEIARKLGISRNTVKLHVRNISLALIARSRTHAVALALRNRIID